MRVGGGPCVQGECMGGVCAGGEISLRGPVLLNWHWATDLGLETPDVGYRRGLLKQTNNNNNNNKQMNHKLKIYNFFLMNQ